MRNVFPILSLTLILAACSAGSSTPAALPATVLPPANQPAAPTVAPVTTVPPTANVEVLQGLTGTTWTWVGFTGPSEQVAVEAPMNYSLVFQEYGNVTISADCNNAQGSYQADGQSLQIEVGAMTAMMCPPGSHSDEFINYLGSAATYSLQDGNLYIDLMADGGTLVFAPSESLTSASGKGALQDTLLANPWQWVSFSNPVQQYDVSSPGNYLLTLHEDGTLDIKADCNTASGTYLMDGNTISIVVGTMTRAACPPGSRSEEFINDLGLAAIYFYQPGEFFIDLTADGGTLKFSPFIP